MLLSLFWSVTVLVILNEIIIDHTVHLVSVVVQKMACISITGSTAHSQFTNNIIGISVPGFNIF